MNIFHKLKNYKLLHFKIDRKLKSLTQFYKNPFKS